MEELLFNILWIPAFVMIMLAPLYAMLIICYLSVVSIIRWISSYFWKKTSQI